MARNNVYGGTTPGTQATPLMGGTNGLCGLMRRINALEGSVLPTESYLRQFGSYGSGDEYILNPHAISIYNGEIYVASKGNEYDSAFPRVNVFDLDGTYKRKWGAPQYGPPANSNYFPPVSLSGISASADGVVTYYSPSNAGYSSMTLTDVSGGSPQTFALYPMGPLYAMGTVSIYAGKVYAVTGGANHVHVFDLTTLSETLAFGPAGGGADEIGDADGGICVFGDAVYVGDSGGLFSNRGVKVFDLSGAYLRTIGSNGSGDGQFNSTIGGIVCLGDEVFASCGNRVQVFTTSGTFKRKWNMSVGGAGIAVNDGDVFVADYGNSHIQVYSRQSISQTEFRAYNNTSAASLGTPDGGVTVPTDASIKAVLSGQARVCTNNVRDMRAAIEAIVATGYFINPATSTPYTLSSLLLAAMGDRTKYGATGGASSTWTNALTSGGVPITDIDFGEILECILLLEAAGTP